MVGFSAMFMTPARESLGVTVKTIAAHITRATLDFHKSEFCIFSPLFVLTEESDRASLRAHSEEADQPFRSMPNTFSWGERRRVRVS